MPSKDSLLLTPNEHVLSTLEADGSRRWLTPKLSKGQLWFRRRVVAYFLLALYSGLPWLRIDGQPAVLIDLPGRTLHLFGWSFLPTDTILLALFVLTMFLGIFFVTAIYGRIWCGWACPQTVYMEFVFRPIERVFLGRAGKGGKPPKEVAAWRRAGMYLTYFIICLHLAQTFIAYFVGTDAVRQWMWAAPTDHMVPFTIVVALTVAMMINFAYWREQLCIIACPYGRLQSVLLDRSSKIVAYDPGRGEPRAPMRKSDMAKAQEAGADAFADRGSCVDCTMCVQVCPTGIDIRDGLQLECVNCTQCIDACDEIMDKTGQPRGLVRFTSGAELEGEQPKVLRPRVVIYGSIISGLAAAFLTLLVLKPHTDITLLRGLGRPYFMTESGLVENSMRVKLTNRTQKQRIYQLEVVEPEGIALRASRPSFTIGPGETLMEPLHVLVPPEQFVAGRLEATLRVVDDEDWEGRKSWRLLGPSRAQSPSPPRSEASK